MLSFHNDPTIKAKYVARVKAHAKADELVQGTGWSDGKGCAVGCTFENYDHSRGPIEIGVPEWLMRLEDTIFEGLAKEDAMRWPVQFLTAMPVGVDFEPIRFKFLLWMQERNLERLKDAPEPYGEQCRAAVRQVIAWIKSEHHSDDDRRSAESAAWSAAWSAESAAWSAAWSADFKEQSGKLLALLKAAR